MDIATLERLVGDLRAAQIQRRLGFQAQVLQHQQVHVAEDELLREILGADHDGAFLRHHRRVETDTNRGSGDWRREGALDNCASIQHGLHVPFRICVPAG